MFSIWVAGVMDIQQPCKSIGNPETEAEYASTINTDSPTWERESVDVYVQSLEPTKTSTDFDHQLTLLIRTEIT